MNAWYDSTPLERFLALGVLLSWIAVVLLSILLVSPAYARRMAIDEQTYTPDPQQMQETLARSGQVWTQTQTLDAAPDAVLPFFVPFKLNLGQSAQWYWGCVSENGSVWFAQLDCSRRTRNIISADESDFAGANTCGACHTDIPRTITVPWNDPWGLKGNVSAAIGLYGEQHAIFFTWYDVHRVGTKGFSTLQLVLVPRDAGDFDVIYNWAESNVAKGRHGFALGGASRWETGGTVWDRKVCVREGKARLCA